MAVNRIDAAILLGCAILFSTLATGHAMTDLIAAADAGDLAAARKAMEGGAKLEERDDRGRTALMAAVHGNHVEIARAHRSRR